MPSKCHVACLGFEAVRSSLTGLPVVCEYFVTSDRLVAALSTSAALVFAAWCLRQQPSMRLGRSGAACKHHSVHAWHKLQSRFAAGEAASVSAPPAYRAQGCLSLD